MKEIHLKKGESLKVFNEKEEADIVAVNKKGELYTFG